MSSPKKATRWNTAASTALYNIDRWGGGYFSVNTRGNLTAHPNAETDTGIDFMEVVAVAREQGLKFPMVVRFQDLLRHRVVSLNEAFLKAISDLEYPKPYRGVFPIKVNQLREVVEEIADAGKPYNFGLEAGSKPELIGALAAHSDPESIIICNGYKDPGFIRLALLGTKLGKEVIMVAEKIEEIEQIIKISKAYGAKPSVGLRVRLSTTGAGKWSSSAGDNSKFGLSTGELVMASDLLKKSGLSDALKLIHFHIGSQVPDVSTISKAVREAARYYAKIFQMDHPSLAYLDVGGGLGVDYDGSRATCDSSVNYTLDEYARSVVYSIKEICEEEKVPCPMIVSESGRALTAHHAVLIVEAFGAISKRHPDFAFKKSDAVSKLARDILDIKDELPRSNRTEQLHDAQLIREQSQNAFDLGILTLRDKAIIDATYWEIAEEIVRNSQDAEHIPEDVQTAETALSDQYACNFSVFQSMIDHWALGQLFPIVPIHRLNTRPDRNATLVDITCDSDGKVSKFIDIDDVKDTLPLHTLHKNEPYYLGIFLVGAYQDIMGDLHNLFGRVNEAHVFLDDDEESGFYIEETIEGSTIADVLSFTQWTNSDLIRRMKKHVDKAIKTDLLKPRDAMSLMTQYEQALKDYTYLTFQETI